MVMSCWIHLGIEPTADEALIRSAYRARLPEHHPETDAEGFQALREAYESAIRLARDNEVGLEEEAFDDFEVPQTIVDFYALLESPERRYNLEAWRAFVRSLDQLPLNVLDDICWGLFHGLVDAGPLSHRCVNLLAQRMAWDQRLQDLEFDQARQVEVILNRIKDPDPFDTNLMDEWPVHAQMEALWYARRLDYLFEHRSLHEYEYFACQHTCLPLPADDSFIKRLLVQFTQAGIGNATWLQLCVEQNRQAPIDVDWLYLLACQYHLLGLEDQALTCWIRLWQEHRHPKAESRLLEICSRRQPDFLPLLIQAFDRLENFRDWSQDLDDVTQEYGSPSQRPETLARWLGVGQLRLQGLAAAFFAWRMTGDELPLLALLLAEHEDSRLQHLYRHAWALHRADAGLLQQILDDAHPIDPLESLVFSGFRYQAEQQLCWLTQAPLPLAMEAFLDSRLPDPQLPEVLRTGEPHQVCRLWLSRMRVYSRCALEQIEQFFALEDLNAAAKLQSLSLLAKLGRQGVVLPAIAQGEAAWRWHVQTMFLLALLDQPERWLKMIDAKTLERLDIYLDHPLNSILPLLRRLQREQAHFGGLLGWLQGCDPVHGLLAQQLSNVQQVLDSAVLPNNSLLYCSVENHPQACGEDLLGLMLLWGVLYHDPSLSTEQHRALLQSIASIICEDEWFEAFRDGLVKGEPEYPSRKVVTDLGADTLLVHDVLDTLRALVRHGSAGVQGMRSLRRLQRAKDDDTNSVSLRLALSALLSWSERLLLVKSESQPAPSAAIWRLDSRLGRKAFIGQVLGNVIVISIVVLLSGTLTAAIAICLLGFAFLFSAVLRRLHDMGRGIASLLIFGCVSSVLPFLPLLLFVVRGDDLPNRYGVPPGSVGGDKLTGGLQATLRGAQG